MISGSRKAQLKAVTTVAVGLGVTRCAQWHICDGRRHSSKLKEAIHGIIHLFEVHIWNYPFVWTGIKALSRLY